MDANQNKIISTIRKYENIPEEVSNREIQKQYKWTVIYNALETALDFDNDWGTSRFSEVVDIFWG